MDRAETSLLSLPTVVIICHTAKATSSSKLIYALLNRLILKESSKFKS